MAAQVYWPLTDRLDLPDGRVGSKFVLPADIVAKAQEHARLKTGWGNCIVSEVTIPYLNCLGLLVAMNPRGDSYIFFTPRGRSEGNRPPRELADFLMMIEPLFRLFDYIRIIQVDDQWNIFGGHESPQNESLINRTHYEIAAWRAGDVEPEPFHSILERRELAATQERERQEEERAACCADIQQLEESRENLSLLRKVSWSLLSWAIATIVALVAVILLEVFELLLPLGYVLGALLVIALSLVTWSAYRDYRKLRRSASS